MIAEIGKIVVRDVAVGPGDVHTCVRRDVDFDAGGFAAGVEWNGHWGKQSSVVSFQSSVKSNDNAEAQRAQRKLLRIAGLGVEGGAAA